MKCLLDLSALSFLWSSPDDSLTSSRVLLILGYVPLGDFSQPGSFGLGCPWTWVSGLVLSLLPPEQNPNPCSCFCASNPSLRRFSHVHLDLLDPLLSSHGFTYLLTMIDRMTCWPEVASLSSITAESCIRAFLFSWVARFSIPFCSHFRSWNTIHLLHLDRSLPFPWDFSIHSYQFSPSE